MHLPLLHYRQAVRGRSIVALMLLGCAAGAPAAPIDPARVIQDVKTLCEFGPRVPGTPGHAAARAWIKKQIEETGLKLWEQPFDAHLAQIQKEAKAFNLWGLPAESKDLVAMDGPIFIVSAHWDTRPIADLDPPGHQGRPFVGANDSASGVCLALEMARSVRGTPLENHLIVAFFDAEDAGTEGKTETYCLGADFAAANPSDWLKKVRLGINLDMIGHKGLRLRWEMWSTTSAPKDLENLWKIGRDLAPSIFEVGLGNQIYDDHVPFTRIGLKYIDLVGLPYEHWHKSSDRPEALEPRVMANVGVVVLEFLRRELRSAK